MQETNDKRKARVIMASVAIASGLYYVAALNEPLYQELSTRFFYLPIFLGGVWFGLGGGIRVSLAVTLICLPNVLAGLGNDGSLLYDEVLEILLFNLAGPTLGALADRERRQRARNQELRSLAVMGEAAASLAHEIKNIVIPMRGFLRRIQEGQTMDEKGQTYLEVVERESGRLEKMTQEMLSFARQASLDCEVMDVNRLVEEVRQTLNKEFRDRGIRLVCLYESEVSFARLDRERIHQALVNLLHNALDASHAGQTVRIQVDRQPYCLRITVVDQGTGIKGDLLKRILSPFFTTKPRGTGLGLAITKRIVEEHGGEIRIESDPGRETRVSLDLPTPVEAHSYRTSQDRTDLGQRRKPHG